MEGEFTAMAGSVSWLVCHLLLLFLLVLLLLRLEENRLLAEKEEEGAEEGEDTRDTSVTDGSVN